MKQNILYVLKRDGLKTEFNENKIRNAIRKAFESNGISNDDIFNRITEKVVAKLKAEGKDTYEVEHIQDIVEKAIADEGYFKIAKAFILYRNKRTNVRRKNARLFQKIGDIIKVTDRENANVGNSPSSKLLQISEASNKDYAELFLTRDTVLEAKRDNLIHSHDYSWYGVGTTTCTFIPLRKRLREGFDTGHGFIRPPKRIQSAASLACIIFQSNQNDQHGGQAFGWFDRDMAPYVKMEYDRQIKRLKEELELFGVDSYDEEKVKQRAWEMTEKATYQAMESLVHNLNSMHARAGAQVPFTSINFGTDTSREGRLVTKMLLLAYEEGLGKGEQPLFPNLIFKVKKGVNFEPDTPNFDLLMLSLRVTSTRLFPNYVFQDCTLNKDFPEDVPVMGCRTRISWNRHKPADEQTCEGRGNISFTSINMVGTALKAKFRDTYTEAIGLKFLDLINQYKISVPEVYQDNKLIETFFVELDRNVDIVIEQLLDRFAYQGTFTKNDFPFLMDGSWMDSDKLKGNDTVANLIKHGTLSVGFIGLAETLKCLVGKHHGEDENADKLGYEIVRFLRAKTDEAAEKHDLNFSLLATPAEGLSGKFTAIDQEKYGIIKGVTDKDWYTNSFHVPVEYETSLFHKIEVEGKYHKLCNAGQISYIEFREAPVENIEGMYAILQHMEKNDMSYVAMNFPVDRCRECGYRGYIESGCHCGCTNISRIRRITGYLAELDQFNHAKKAEALHRVKHN